MGVARYGTMRALLSIWGHLGIGCLMFSNGISINLVKQVQDYYTLDRLDPGYRVFFPEDLCVDIPGNEEELFQLFDRLEENGGEKLRIFLNNAKAKYEAGMNDLVHRPSISFTEFIDFSIAKQLPKLKLFTSLTAEIKQPL